MDAELERRYRNVRAAMAEHELDALIVVRQRVLAASRAPSPTSPASRSCTATPTWSFPPTASRRSSSRPRRATSASTGRRSSSRSSTTGPGEHIAATARDRGWKRVGVYGLDYIMTVRDFRALEGLDLVPFDAEFDLARAVKSDAELESVRESVRINEDGFEAFLAAYEPGKTAAEVMAPAEELFVERGCGRLTMNMVLIGPEFGIAKKETTLGDFVLPSLEVAGPGMHWVEVSRAIGTVPAAVEPMVEAYGEYHAAAREAMRDGATAHDVHRAVSKGFTERGYHLGHVTGHSIGMTMIEHPRVGEGMEAVLRSGMVLSMHPHAIAADGKACLYMQDTWLVTDAGGEPLSRLPMKVY